MLLYALRRMDCLTDIILSLIQVSLIQALVFAGLILID